MSHELDIPDRQSKPQAPQNLNPHLPLPSPNPSHGTMLILTLDQLLSPSYSSSTPMYLSPNTAVAANTKPHRQIGFYRDSAPRKMTIQLYPNSTAPLPPESNDDNYEVKTPKKRADTWIEEETRILIGFRHEMDGLFNTSKSNQHLWEQISAKMRDKGFDRSPTMCNDKWRNLLKEFKKAKHRCKGSGPTNMSYFKVLDEFLNERSKHTSKSLSAAAAAMSASKVDKITKKDKVVMISVALIVILFSVQRYATRKVGFVVGPALFIWFCTLGGIGIYNLLKYDARAFNPVHIYYYYYLNSTQAWMSPGCCLLCAIGKDKKCQL